MTRPRPQSVVTSFVAEARAENYAKLLGMGVVQETAWR